MSQVTAFTENTFSTANARQAPSDLWAVPNFRDYGQPTGGADPVAGRIMTPLSSRKKSTERRKVVRRLKGFVVSFNGEEARVAFVQGGQPFFYDIPASNLSKKGISAVHQPFEMDEVLLELEPYAPSTAYEFRPLAKASDGYPEPLHLDAERQRKRDLIFEKFGTHAS